MTPEHQEHVDDVLARNERLENRFIAVARRPFTVLLTAIAFVVVLQIVTSIQLIKVQQSNHSILVAHTNELNTVNHAVTATIPGLRAEVTRLDHQLTHADRTIADAVAIILKLARQVKALGGNPGQISLK
jgi:hypothetical protein